MEVTSVNLLGQLSILFMNLSPIETDFLIQIYCTVYTRESLGMHLSVLPYTAAIKALCSKKNTDILTVTQPRLCKLLLASCVKYHRHDGGFKTACVLYTVKSIQGIKYVSGLNWKLFKINTKPEFQANIIPESIIQYHIHESFKSCT